MKLEKISDIIPLIEQGYTLAHIGRHILKPRRTPDTMYRYLRKLREAGYIIKTQRGKKKLEI